MERRAFLVEVDLNDLLGIVPCAAGVRHIDGLEEAEAGDRDQIRNEEVGVEQRESERNGHQSDKDVPHPFLSVLGADFDNRLGILYIGCCLFHVHVLFNELDGPVSPSGNRLHGGPTEPVDHCAATNQADNNRRVG